MIEIEETQPLEINPYAAPVAETCESLEDKSPHLDSEEAFLFRQRARLASSFRTVGILLAMFAFVLYLTLATAAQNLFLISMLVATVLFSLWYFLAADRIIRGDRTVRYEAIFLSGLIALGFPLFTGTGLRCIYLIRNYL